MQTNPCTKTSEVRMSLTPPARTRKTKGAKMSTLSTINPRWRVKTAGALALATAVLATFAIGQETGALRKPNILLIYADDLGWGDVGYQSDGRFLTPNIDRLAREGVVFSNSYSCGANCAPSRASILSGGYTARHGLMANGTTARGPMNHQRLVPIPTKRHLEASFVTMAEALKTAGYATAHFGKWHVASRDPGTHPSGQGFDVAYHAFSDSTGGGALKGEGVAGWESLTDRKGPPNDPSGVYTMTDKAVEFMASNRNRPFFVYLAHYAIHAGARNARPESRQLVAERGKAANISDLYIANTYDFDDSVGKLLGKLRELELEDNTLVVFTSDNGASRDQSLDPVPLSGRKGTFYEGGIRVPLIVRWPGVTQAGATCSTPVSQVDFYPTFLAAAGVPVPTGAQLDGVSLLPALKQPDGGLNRASIFWHFPGYIDNPNRARDPVFGSRPISVIRKGDWKLLLYHEEWALDGGRAALATNNAVELYNLKDDIGEHKNLALENTAKRDELLDDLLKWIADNKLPMPNQKNPAYDPNAKP